MSNITQLRAFTCLVLLVGTQAAEEVRLPSSITIPNCNHNLPDYSACLTFAFQQSWPAIVKGIPELDTPVLDPLKLHRVEQNYMLDIVTTHFFVSNVKVYGFSGAIFEAVRSARSGNRMIIWVDYFVPMVTMVGYYEAYGGVYPFLIGGRGWFNATSEGNRGTFSVEGRIENDRWVIEHVSVNYPDTLHISKMTFYFDDVFNGIQSLNDWALSYVNKNWRLHYKALVPLVNRQWDPSLTEILNRLVFSKLSFAKTFP